MKPGTNRSTPSKLFGHDMIHYFRLTLNITSEHSCPSIPSKHNSFFYYAETKLYSGSLNSPRCQTNSPLQPFQRLSSAQFPHVQSVHRDLSPPAGHPSVAKSFPKEKPFVSLDQPNYSPISHHSRSFRSKV